MKLQEMKLVTTVALATFASLSTWSANRTYTDSPTGADSVTIVNDDASSVTTWRPTSVDGWTGDLVLTLGILKFDAQSLLGSGTIYNNNESGSAYRRLEFTAASGTTRTVSNAIVLGTENMAGWQDRIRITGGGTVKFTGPMTVNASKMFVYASSTCYVQGGVTGKKAIFAPAAGNAVYIDTKPVAVTDSFWTRDASVYLNVAGSSFPAYYGGGAGRLVLGGTDFFPAVANFASQNDSGSSASLDLNGFDQHLGGHAGEGAATRPFTIANTKANTRPTVTINQNASDNTGRTLCFSGPMNVVKEGAKTLSLKTGVRGDLTVKAGRLLLGPNVVDLANAVTVEDGVLDLGGTSVFCDTLVVKTGATVRNGTITARQTTVEPGAFLEVAVAGPVSTAGEGRFVVTSDFALQPSESRTYQLPTDTAVYFPFDGSLTEALRDCSGGHADLVVYEGNPSFVAEGRSGGCLYFNGATQLRTATFPDQVPTGAHDVTCAAWIKVDSGCSNRGGWLSYGDTAKTMGSSFCFNGKYTGIKWYANDVDGYGNLSAGLDDGAWHSVVGTQSGSTRRIYVDGVLVGMDSSKPLNVTGTLFMIGKTMWDDAFKGWIDDVLIVKRALSADEIKALYDAGGVPRTVDICKKTLDIAAGTVLVPGPGIGTAPVMRYAFDSAATLFQDSSGNGYTLKTLNGTPTYAEGVAPVPTSSGSLRVQSVRMTVDGAFPAKLPVGNASHTVCTYIKAQTVAQATGWFGYGANATRQGNNLGYNWGNPPGICSSWYGSDWSGAAVDATTWHSVVSTYDKTSGIRTFYIDGKTIRSGADTPNFAAANFYLGCNVPDYSRMFNGWLDQVAVYDVALSAEQVATYHAQGLSSGTLASDTVVRVAAGAVLDFNGTKTSQTLAGLSGAGTVRGDVTLADGAETDAADGAAVTIAGTLTFAGGGTVVLPETIAATPAIYPLFTARDYSGLDNLASWQFVNVPKGKKANLRIRDGTVEALVCASGMTVIFR